MDLRTFAGAVARYSQRRESNWIIPGTAFYDWSSSEFIPEDDQLTLSGYHCSQSASEVYRCFVADLCEAEAGNGRSLQHGWRTNTNPNRLADRLYTWRSCDY